MDIKGKLERHLTGRLPSLGGEVDKIPFARAVYKACDSKDQAPKTKHIRHILFPPPLPRYLYPPQTSILCHSLRAGHHMVLPSEFGVAP